MLLRGLHLVLSGIVLARPEYRMTFWLESDATTNTRVELTSSSSNERDTSASAAYGRSVGIFFSFKGNCWLRLGAEVVDASFFATELGGALS